MPHQCIKCSTIYSNQEMELQNHIMMCKCGSKAFFFLRRELDVPEAVRIEIMQQANGEHIIIDGETFEGKYEVDLQSLLQQEPIVEESEGKYTINLDRLNRH